MKLKNRKECLFTLRGLGYEVGAGFMVGSPGQTVECLVEDFEFLQELKPHMIGIGPFLAIRIHHLVQKKMVPMSRHFYY